MLMAWCPAVGLHNIGSMCPKERRRSLRVIVVSGQSEIQNISRTFGNVTNKLRNMIVVVK